MSHGVHLQVTIPTGSPDKLKALASEAFSIDWGLQILADVNDLNFVEGAEEAYEFLNDIKESRFHWKWGNQGDLFLWGMVGNHTNPIAFARTLIPFWLLLFERNDEFISLGFHKILILYTQDGGGESGYIEIGWDDYESQERVLELRHREAQQFRYL